MPCGDFQCFNCGSYYCDGKCATFGRMSYPPIYIAREEDMTWKKDLGVDVVGPQPPHDSAIVNSSRAEETPDRFVVEDCTRPVHHDGPCNGWATSRCKGRPVCRHGARLETFCKLCEEDIIKENATLCGPLMCLKQCQKLADCVLPKDTTTKPTNPKDSVSIRKARWFSYIPVRVMIGVGLALLEGARKYGRHNYRPAGVLASVYVDAVVCGHITKWWEGQDIDKESGLNHIDKAIASLVVLRDSMLEGNWVDDRPPAVKDLDAMFEEADRQAIAIIERYPDPKPAHTQLRG